MLQGITPGSTQAAQEVELQLIIIGVLRGKVRHRYIEPPNALLDTLLLEQNLQIGFKGGRSHIALVNSNLGNGLKQS